jgi:alkanesulfonate monooxygenase SsuD/methylene tetrahydromethanopterin reductase-like flavin-dependent oxidoreductase (luciferase family)
MPAVSEERQPGPRGTGFALRDPWPWSTFADLARDGEALGYSALFLPEIAGRDVFAALTGLAGETERISLGTGVVPISSRRSATIAMAASTVHERSGGRLVLGLGTGAPRRGALAALEAAVGEVRGAVDRAMASPPAGDGVLALGSPIPIWIAALGPKAVRLAGRIADGVLLNWCSPERVAQARDQLAEGAADAGRDPTSIVVGAYVRAAIGEDVPAGAGEDVPAGAGEDVLTGPGGALARAASGYAALPAYRRQFDAMGLTDADSIVSAVCLRGGSDQARERLAAYVDAGCDLPVVYPVPFGADPAGSVLRTLRALAPAV